MCNEEVSFRSQTAFSEEAVSNLGTLSQLTRHRSRERGREAQVQIKALAKAPVEKRDEQWLGRPEPLEKGEGERGWGIKGKQVWCIKSVKFRFRPLRFLK
jgi:hypothetical protein